VARIVLKGVTKRFKGSVAVDHLDLEVEDGEFLVIVGPSGCGKTTTLRMLAGFDTPTSGSVIIGGKRVNDVPPKDRNLAMVFQNYALFPHMTVEKNLAYGLKVRHEAKASIRPQIGEVAEMLGIERLLGRKPAELSGGERQRVALGRALLRKPQAFLLDEPLSNLDAALRTQMRTELQRIHRQFPVTTIYVTHDQVEAMTMADRVALMHQGRLQQIATPEALYEEPASAFVAGFIGSPKINLVPGRVHQDGTSVVVSCMSCEIPVNGSAGAALTASSAGSLLVGFRPEEIRLASERAGGLPVVTGTVEVIEPLGPETHVVVRVGDELLTCKFPARSGLSVGAAISLELDVAQMKLFDAASGDRVR
jgi:multiple sugar transport system ATP-binding protein